MPELLFLNLTMNVMATAYAVEANSFRADKPQLWTPMSLLSAGINYPNDLHRDGRRSNLTSNRSRHLR